MQHENEPKRLTLGYHGVAYTMELGRTSTSPVSHEITRSELPVRREGAKGQTPSNNQICLRLADGGRLSDPTNQLSYTW